MASGGKPPPHLDQEQEDVTTRRQRRADARAARKEAEEAEINPFARSGLQRTPPAARREGPTGLGRAARRRRAERRTRSSVWSRLSPARESVPDRPPTPGARRAGSVEPQSSESARAHPDQGH
jgi:hypothetical protein